MKCSLNDKRKHMFQYRPPSFLIASRNAYWVISQAFQTVQHTPHSTTSFKILSLKVKITVYTFLNFLAHSPDNLFLGFVVDTTLRSKTVADKKPMGVVYGKLGNFYKVNILLMLFYFSKSQNLLRCRS